MIEKRSIDELLEVAKLEEVAGQFLTLSQRGANRKADACPFCGAKKKFSVNVPKQLYKCFECDKGGAGALKFLREARGMEYLPAVQWLADFYKFILRDAETGDAETGVGFDTSYFVQRMQDIGYKQERGQDKGLFRARSDGGIDIRYPHLYPDGPAWQQHKGADFVRTRLHPERAKPDQKYHQEGGSGIHIFIPPVVVKEWREGVKWETLFVVEGEFKAFAAARPGVPVVGIAGIKMYMEKKGSKNLHADLVQLLRNATAVCLVHDADALQVKWDPIAEPDKDLGQRRRDFASAVTGFKFAVGTLVPARYYAYIHKNYQDTAKGLDDLIAREGADRVVERMVTLSTNTYFQFFDITNEEWRGINKIFHLNLYKGVPQKFYDHNSQLIGERPFYFAGGRYQYVVPNDESGIGELTLLTHPDSKHYIAVGTDFFKRVHLPDENGRAQPMLIGWTESNLMRRYVRKGVPNFLDTLDTYDAFVNEPGHHEDYRSEVIIQPEEFGPRTRLLNKYRPIDHHVKRGTYKAVEGYLKHVFGTHDLKTIDDTGKELASSEAWQVYLDRWTIMYRIPRQRLPAVVLASKETNTGKSTLLWFNLMIWQGNAVVIGNNAISDQFTADWVDKTYVGIDETSIDKKQDTEKMKSLITAPVASRRGMYKDREQTANFTKFDLTTNNEDSFLSIAEDEFRYWVNRVQRITHRDPFLLQKMQAEIPALLYDLRHREIIHPQLNRLWFADSVIDTEARREVASASLSWLEKEFRAWITEQFYTFRWPELYFMASEIRDGVNNMNGARFRLGEITDLLRKKMKVCELFTYVTVPKLPHLRKAQGVGTADIGTYEKSRWYVFRAKDWVKESEADEILRDARAEWALSGNGAMESEFPLHHPN